MTMSMSRHAAVTTLFSVAIMLMLLLAHEAMGGRSRTPRDVAAAFKALHAQVSSRP